MHPGTARGLRGGTERVGGGACTRTRPADTHGHMHTPMRAHTKTHMGAYTRTHTPRCRTKTHTHRCARAPTPRCTRVFASNSKAVCFVCSGGRGRDGAGVSGLASCCCRPSRRAQSPRPHCRQSQLLTCGLVPLGQPAPGPRAVVLVWCGAGTAPRGSTDRHREQMAGRRLGAASGPFTVLSDSF